jgi:hypothetical protein
MKTYLLLFTFPVIAIACGIAVFVSSRRSRKAAAAKPPQP